MPPAPEPVSEPPVDDTEPADGTTTELEPSSLMTINAAPDAHDSLGAEVRVTVRSAGSAVVVAQATAVMVVDTSVPLPAACAAQVYAWKAGGCQSSAFYYGEEN